MDFALHPEAVEDLDQIHEYIDRSNPSAADRVLDEIFAAFDSLAHLPHQGSQRPDLTSRPLRFKIV